MCDICKVETNIDYIITDKDRRFEICPNCVAKELAAGRLRLTASDQFIDDITEERGAVQLQAYREQYILKPATMLRLLNHSLRRDEYKAIVDRYSFVCAERSELPSLIHDDFYTKDGTILCQMLSDKELARLYQI